MKLNIGSGPHCGGHPILKEWTCVDDAHEPGKPEWDNAQYMKFDITEPWPVDADTVDCIFASHILEHIVYEKQRRLAEHCFRALKPGAPIRIICPDPRIFVRNWQERNMQFVMDCYGKENWERNGYATNPNKAFTDMFFSDNYDHVLAPSIDMIAVMLIRAGFSRVSEMQYCNTRFPQYFGTYDATLDNRPVMSWYLEAVK